MITTSSSDEQYAGKRILITGASGFLGRHLLARLAAHECNVAGISRQHRTETHRNVRWYQADLTDIAATKAIFSNIRPDIVFHLTSESRGNTSIENVLPCFKNDLEATINCLIAACDNGRPRFVMTGSMEEPRLHQDNSDPNPVPSTPYAAAKFAGVFYGRMFHHLYQLPVVVLRPFMTYGPGQKEYKVIPYTILSLLRDQSPQLSSGNRLIDWIYVSDVIEAFVRSGIAPHAPGEILELGSQQAVSLRQIVKRLHDLIGGPPPSFGTMADWGENGKVSRASSTSLVLGWRPVVTLDDGLRQTIEWYRRNLSR